MTNEQIILMAVTGVLLAVIAARFVIGAINAYRGAKILGKRNDNTAACEIARKQLKFNETLLYCARRTAQMYVGVTLLVLSVLFFCGFIALIFSGVDRNDLLPILVLFMPFLGVAVVMAFVSCRAILDGSNTIYFVTEKRLCVMSLTSGGYKNRDVPAETIKKLRVVYRVKSQYVTKRSKIAAIRVEIHGRNAVILRPNGMAKELVGILYKIAKL